MKNKILKIIKNNIFGFVLGAFLFGFIGASAANYLYNSNQISYNNESSTVTDVKGAIDEIYNKIDNSIIGDLTSSTQLYSFGSTTGTGPSNVYATKSYTYTETDINNQYKYLLFSISSGGATTYMWIGLESISVPKGMVLFTSSISGNASNATVYNRVYLINVKNISQGEQIFSVKFRGLAIIKLIGLK